MTIELEIIKNFKQNVNSNSPFYRKFVGYTRNLSDITHIGIHGTGGGLASDSDSLDYILGQNVRRYTVGEFHYFIGKTGKIYELLSPEKGTLAGNLPINENNPNYGTLPHEPPFEKNIISIEHLNLHNNNERAYTDEQKKASFELILYLLQTYTTITGIVGHGAGMANWYPEQGNYKVCPGPFYPWSDLLTYLTDRGYGYSTKDISYKNKWRGARPRYPAIKGIAKNEFIYDITLINPNAPVSESDKKTNEEIAVTNETNYDHYNDGNENIDGNIFKDDPFSYHPETMKEIANEDLEIERVSLGAWQPVGTANFTFSVSDKFKLSTKKVLYNTISWTIMGCVLTGKTHGGGASSSPIISTTIKTKIENFGVLRKEDVGICTGNFEGIPCTCNFKISNAGQTKTKSN